jgi:hypothetical protein
MGDLPIINPATAIENAAISQNLDHGIPLAQRVTPSINRFSQLAVGIGQTLRVAIPAVVNSFDPIKGTITAQVAVNDLAQWNQNPAGKPINVQLKPITLGGMQKNQAIIPDIPVAIYNAGGWSITMPIQQGDECLLVFNDAEIDMWFQNGGSANNTISSRRHSPSDAIAVFGLRSTPRALQNYSTTAMQIRNDDGSVIIELTPGFVIINAPNGTVQVYAKEVQVQAVDTATVQGATVNVEGSSAVNINGSGHTTIDGVPFKQHTHSGVSTGSGISGPVVP